MKYLRLVGRVSCCLGWHAWGLPQLPTRPIALFGSHGEQTGWRYEPTGAPKYWRCSRCGYTVSEAA